MEASGTGNMKLSLNGALTIGTLDGANIEICEHVGADNIFIFGLRTEEVEERRRQGYNPGLVIEQSSKLSDVVGAIEHGAFSPGDPGRFAPLMDALRHSDYYMVAADFEDYFAAQRRVDQLWRSGYDWTRASILNTARMAWFSSDRTISEYAGDVWDVPVSNPADAGARKPE
jgi:starch phosphorylase